MLIGSELKKSFVIERNFIGRPTKQITAVDGVSVAVKPGSTVAVVGESGCGKSTLAELILMLQTPDSGSVTLDGKNVTGANSAELRSIRRQLQVVFQDPYSSLDPSQTIGSALEEPLVIHRIGTPKERRERVQTALDRVGLGSITSVFERYPSEFSGGQRQRIAIARALIVEPKYVMLDEAVSALDVSTQAQVMSLLGQLQDESNLGYLFISHDLGVVRHLADEVAVMYLGKVVEAANVLDLYSTPRHPYTAALLASVPQPDPDRQRKRRALAVAGEPPDPADRPSGCAFHPRCPYAREVCAEQQPELRVVGDTQVACHFADELQLAGADPKVSPMSS